MIFASAMFNRHAPICPDHRSLFDLRWISPDLLIADVMERKKTSKRGDKREDENLGELQSDMR